MSRSCRRPSLSRKARRREYLIAFSLLAALAVVPGCACVPDHEPGSQIELASLSSTEERPALRGPGASPTAPIERCGPRDSYDYLASQFRCPGPGKNPFRGNWREAANHRVGSTALDQDEGHMLDVYEVPCNTGPVRVYVDMYSCSSARP